MGMNNFNFDFLDPNHGHKRALIINSGKLDGAAMGNLEEDLNVMSRILEKSADKGSAGHEDMVMGIAMQALGGFRQAENLYLENYGVVFLLNVRFPLVQPMARTEEKREEPGNSSWDEAKRELYGPRDNPLAQFRGGDGPRVPKFEAEKVESLKSDLLQALKNATHIRGVKPDESVTVVVTGPESGRMGQPRATAYVRGNGNNQDNDPGAQRREVRQVTRATAGAGAGGGRPSTLFIRAKKSDIDSFAKGKLSQEEFTKKAQVAAY